MCSVATGDGGSAPGRRDRDRRPPTPRFSGAMTGAFGVLPVTALAMLGLCAGCAGERQLIVETQPTCIHTNTYLVYADGCREAALIDIAGPVDSLLSIVEDQDLELRYVLATHSHFDHTMGIPAIQEHFPEAMICMSRQAYDDMLIQTQWGIETHGDEWIEMMEADPGTKSMLGFDPATVGEPDIFLTDGARLSLGELEIRAVLTPGHSRGHMCYGVGGALFSGDLLYHHDVGHTGWLGGSEEQLRASVLRLYETFVDETAVYPGHGPATSIGEEKRSNAVVRSE